MENLKAASRDRTEEIRRSKASSDEKERKEAYNYERLKNSRIQGGLREVESPKRDELNVPRRRLRARYAAGFGKSAGNQEQESLEGATISVQSKKKSLFSKVLNHWAIFLTSVFFDLIGLIPLINIFSNALFALILFIVFGIKKKADSQSAIFTIVLPMTVGAAVDTVLSFFPTCMGGCLVRIYFAEE